MSNLVTTSNRLSQVAVNTAVRHLERIRTHVRVQSDTLTTACRQSGLPLDLAEVCAGLLASVIEDLQMIGATKRSDFMRTKRKERVLACTDEPQASALRLAIGASPINGRAAAAHWDAICEQWEIGKFAWLLGMDTETAYGYGRRLERRRARE